MADETVWKRPRADDDEEELLRQQAEFLTTQQQPSVKVTNRRDPAGASGDAPSAGRVRSRFWSLRQSQAKRDAVSTSAGSGEMINPVVKDTMKRKLVDMVQNVPATSSSIILGNIMERKLDIEKYKFDDNRVPTADEQGFPKVFGFDDTSLTKEVCPNKTHLLFFFMLYYFVTLCRSMVSRAYSGRKFQNLSLREVIR